MLQHAFAEVGAIHTNLGGQVPVGAAHVDPLLRHEWGVRLYLVMPWRNIPYHPSVPTGIRRARKPVGTGDAIPDQHDTPRHLLLVVVFNRH
jgi:hypothetical protein